MKIDKVICLALISVAISSCYFEMPNLGAVNVDKVVESAPVYCEDYNACKVQVDSSIKVEDYDIYNTYTSAYQKVSEVSVIVNGFNYTSTNTDSYTLSAYYSGFIFDKQIKDASTYEYYVLSTGLKLQDNPYYEVSLNDGTVLEAKLKGLYNDVNYHLSVFTFETS